MVMSNYPLHSVMGVEIEYMLVDKDNLNVQPKSDVILKSLSQGELKNEIELGDIAISNELVMHVLELKNNGPKSLDAPIAEHFQNALLNLEPLLSKHNLQLLPSGAHPWMNPLTETKRWPYGNNEIYQQYDQIFDCKGHGWSNLQSMHVNLPFSNDQEFCELHNSIRLLLPLLPAICASSPLLNGIPTGHLSSRLYYYENNQKKIHSISGELIPEFIVSETEYQEKILQPMYKEISPYDPKGILQFEWLNSRAAIPKFDVKAVEIRILDSQECINADLAIAYVIHALLKELLSQSDLHLKQPLSVKHLKSIFDPVLKHGLNHQIDDSAFLSQWQLPAKSMTMTEVWSQLIEKVSPQLHKESQRALENMLRNGSLSERILKACQNDFSKSKVTQVYRKLGDCLMNNELFIA